MPASHAHASGPARASKKSNISHLRPSRSEAPTCGYSRGTHPAKSSSANGQHAAERLTATSTPLFLEYIPSMSTQILHVDKNRHSDASRRIWFTCSSDFACLNSRQQHKSRTTLVHCWRLRRMYMPCRLRLGSTACLGLRPVALTAARVQACSVNL